MKWFIYSLLLVNLSVFVWYYQSMNTVVVRDIGVQAPHIDAGVKRLRLLGERVSKVGVTSGMVQCQGIGPFPRHKQAKAARARLRTAGMHWVIHDVALPDKTGYWVFLPPFGSRRAARAAITALKAKGIHDYFLIGTGEKKNGVSLGVFSSRALAKQRVAQIRDNGLSPEQGTVPLVQRQYWLSRRSAEFDRDVKSTKSAKPSSTKGVNKRALAVLHGDYPDIARGSFACVARNTRVH